MNITGRHFRNLPHSDSLTQTPSLFRKNPGMHWHSLFSLHSAVHTVRFLSAQFKRHGTHSGKYSFSAQAKITEKNYVAEISNSQVYNNIPYLVGTNVYKNYYPFHRYNWRVDKEHILVCIHFLHTLYNWIKDNYDYDNLFKRRWR